MCAKKMHIFLWFYFLKKKEIDTLIGNIWVEE